MKKIIHEFVEGKTHFGKSRDAKMCLSLNEAK